MRHIRNVLFGFVLMPPPAVAGNHREARRGEARLTPRSAPVRAAPAQDSCDLDELAPTQMTMEEFEAECATACTCHASCPARARSGGLTRPLAATSVRAARVVCAAVHHKLAMITSTSMPWPRQSLASPCWPTSHLGLAVAAGMSSSSARPSSAAAARTSTRASSSRCAPCASGNTTCLETWKQPRNSLETCLETWKQPRNMPGNMETAEKHAWKHGNSLETCLETWKQPETS